MDKFIRTFTHDTPEYKRLERAAKILTAASPRKFTYKVEETYFDFGQNWLWTTIICYRPDGESYQALYPADQEAILTSDNLIAALAQISQGKYWLDNAREADEAFRKQVETLLSSAMGGDYAMILSRNHAFLEEVKEDVETSAETDYNDDDIRLAIGRVILGKLGIPA